MTATIDILEAPYSDEYYSTSWGKAEWIPLTLILALQTALTVRLFHLGIASDDEARYIYSGHQLIYELWHGGGSPYYETYLSGAPTIYPVLAAIVDHVGHLAAVRLMSLSFMLIATTAMFATTRRLFGYWPAVGAAGLFAGVGLTQDLGAYATYDAMSLMLMAIAAYCAIRAGEDGDFGDRWLLLVPAVLVLANATKYATILFDPVVIGMAAIRLHSYDRTRIWRRSLALLATTGCLAVLITFLAGSAYLKGILFTTLDREGGTQALLGATSTPSGLIIIKSWDWIGAIIVLGVIATVVSIAAKKDSHQSAMLALLVTGGILVTLEGLRLHSDESMRKHDDFGIWFTCMAAGYLLSYACSLTRRWRHWYAVVAMALATLIIASPDAYYSLHSPSTYPAAHDTSYLSAWSTVKPYLNRPGRFLLGGIEDDELIYTEHLKMRWYDYFDDVYIKYPIPGRGGDSHGQVPGPACQSLKPGCMYLEGIAGYRAAIHAHWFTVICMVGNHAVNQDTEIERAVESTPGYRLVTRVGGGPTWVYTPSHEN